MQTSRQLASLFTSSAQGRAAAYDDGRPVAVSSRGGSGAAMGAKDGWWGAGMAGGSGGEMMSPEGDIVLRTGGMPVNASVSAYQGQEVLINCSFTGSDPLFTFHFSDTNWTVFSDGSCVTRHVFNSTGEFEVVVVGSNAVSESSAAVVRVTVGRRPEVVVVSAVAAPLVITLAIVLIMFSVHRCVCVCVLFVWFAFGVWSFNCCIIVLVVIPLSLSQNTLQQSK